MRFTTPPGTSEVASTSVSVTAGSGRDSEARTTAALPRHDDRRQPADQSQQARRPPAAMIPTTPVGSGTLKLK